MKEIHKKLLAKCNELQDRVKAHAEEENGQKIVFENGSSIHFEPESPLSMLGSRAMISPLTFGHIPSLLPETIVSRKNERICKT